MTSPKELHRRTRQFDSEYLSVPIREDYERPMLNLTPPAAVHYTAGSLDSQLQTSNGLQVVTGSGGEIPTRYCREVFDKRSRDIRDIPLHNFLWKIPSKQHTPVILAPGEETE